MSESGAVWLVIVVALAGANLPFLLQRPLVLLPRSEAGAPPGRVLGRWLESLLYFLVFYLVLRGAYQTIGTALVMASDPGSRLLFLGRILGYGLSFGALLAFPGWRDRHRTAAGKSFAVRLLEVILIYLAVGVLGLALEYNMGSRFPQTWEFYAITGSLFVVLGYPGFVFRYLLKRSKAPRKRAQASEKSSG